VTDPAWVPPALIERSAVRGSALDYIERLYLAFTIDLVDSQPTYKGKRVGAAPHRQADGKHTIFWHVVTGQHQEFNDRLLDETRAARIRWIRPLIEAADQGLCGCWVQERGTAGPRVQLVTPGLDFVVVLEDRPTYYQLVTAYVVAHGSYRRKITKWLRESPCP